MPLSAKQRELIEKHLFWDELDEEEAKANVKLSRRDLRFLIRAIQYYHDTCCPGQGKGDECGMIGWDEDVHSGAIAKYCLRSCSDWIDALLSDEVVSQLPSRASTKA